MVVQMITVGVSMPLFADSVNPALHLAIWNRVFVTKRPEYITFSIAGMVSVATLSTKAAREQDPDIPVMSLVQSRLRNPDMDTSAVLAETSRLISHCPVAAMSARRQVARQKQVRVPFSCHSSYANADRLKFLCRRHNGPNHIS